jgi:hypothetical protein
MTKVLLQRCKDIDVIKALSPDKSDQRLRAQSPQAPERAEGFQAISSRRECLAARLAQLVWRVSELATGRQLPKSPA